MPVDIRSVDQTGTSWGQQAMKSTKEELMIPVTPKQSLEWILALGNTRGVGRIMGHATGSTGDSPSYV